MLKSDILNVRVIRICVFIHLHFIHAAPELFKSLHDVNCWDRHTEHIQASRCTHDKQLNL